MPGIIRKLLSFRNLFHRRKPEPGEIAEEKWIADFSKESRARFLIKSESSYDANLRKNLFYSGHSLTLGLKKTGCIAWTEAPEQRYRDLAISGALRIDAMGGYGAGGMLFRMLDNETYYSFLISSKGFFRLDALRNGMPFPLVGWTELPLSSGAAPEPDQTVDFSIIAYGSHIVIAIRGRWAAEVNDSSILEGSVCFAAASYETGNFQGVPAEPSGETPAPGTAGAPEDGGAKEGGIKDDGASPEISGGKTSPYVTEVFLESLAVESRIAEVSSLYEKWLDSPDIDPKARLNLAETFAAMNQHNAAMVQLRKSWDAPGSRKSQRELLLAGRLALALGLMADAEAYIGQCFQADVESPDGKAALTEMAKILYIGERFEELRDYCKEAVKLKSDDPALRTLQGHAYWSLNDRKKAVEAYDAAFELDGENGILAKNAANVYAAMGRGKEALARYLEAGRAFLKTGNYADLGLLIPVFHSQGKDSWEARSLAGKWAFAVEDWEMAKAEFARSEELRKARRPRPQKDGAVAFLEALLLIRAGKRREAIPFLEEAVSLEKGYALFRFRLAENLFLLEGDPRSPRMRKELDAALALLEKDSESGENSAAGTLRRAAAGGRRIGIPQLPPDKAGELAGWVHNFAAQTALQREDLEAAGAHLEKAVRVLGDLPEVRINQAVLFYIQGSPEKALELLDENGGNDPEGAMANCAGNLLVRSRRFEDADEKYRRALALAPDNVEYLCNRASCLIELRRYGEADELLARAHAIAPSPDLLEMISFVAARKGEYPRAEQACRQALEADPSHAPSLLSLGWILFTLGRHEEAGETLARLDKLELREAAAKGREELRSRLEALVYQTIECASCGGAWKIPKNPPPAPGIRLYATPPDDLPGGSCPACGKTYCIGCAKKKIDSNGRFICPVCGRALKLVNEGLKNLIHDWAVADGLVKTEKSGGKKPGRGRPPKKGSPDGQDGSGATPPGPALPPPAAGKMPAAKKPPKPKTSGGGGKLPRASAGEPGPARELSPGETPDPASPEQVNRGAEPAAKTPPEKTAPSPAPVKRGRGRPRKTAETPPAPAARAAGRRNAGVPKSAEEAPAETPPAETPPAAPPKRGRGRPPKKKPEPPPPLPAKRGKGRGSSS